MKKRKLTSLRLNKKSISNLNSNIIGGAKGWFTTGCTDGCTPFATEGFCTLTNCTADCVTYDC
jgi:hypothetical protein